MIRRDADLKNILKKIDGKGYKAYKDIEDVFDFKDYILYIDHVSGDPFALPSRFRVRVSQCGARFPGDAYHNRSREIALRDFLARRFYDAARRYSRGNRGTGKSGLISIDRPGQEMLERTSLLVNDEFVEARILMGLPAFGRNISGRDARAMIFDELPQIIRSSLFFEGIERERLYRHIETAEDADYIRDRLDSLNLVAFISDGALLPRRSGVDDRPLEREKSVPFDSPESLRVSIELPNRGEVRGMGIPKGITLIVGGGYHGKSTLLKAIELGIYNHIPGDGREFVITNPYAVKIRAEDGRRIEKTSITPFISNLPFGKDTTGFSSDDASGSTSQSANILEALEVGCQALLIDEDTSATNFMIRDHRMQELVVKDREPITPFIDKVKQLYNELGVSSILVIGGSGDYFDVADYVICMVDYKPNDLTSEAQAIAHKYRAERRGEGGDSFGMIAERIPLSHSINPGKGRREVKISSKGLHSIAFGENTIDLGSVEQLVDISQTRAIGDAINYARKYMDGERTMKEIIGCVLDDIDNKGLDVLNNRPVVDYVEFRGLELAAAINRLRTIIMKQRG
ncbi:MAG: ABC-ATPase domain-containing protein [Spirochaetota bacterium]|nr:ABC-ATPase domain-containing protein [Spirochaetota bacterium]